ncbi:hypothetical protein [Streptomyces rubradiris]|uniref:Uncharacterized protein n=1 Tax=Streptomyces rubradiris TaxID=285531 RepID=A0ABQ3RC67_STRRR|nr:hypothetical protein [Streptomyces rubradiris]GHG93125.1 hypothetical protein GCM10018792_01850 [Streptomyces rubradiris]GHI53446.1 hypothetical protein Srubr_32920 [Streptomyces rubradiris]
MMASQPDPDLSNSLAMLHTAVMHTDKNIRDALDKSVEKLESAGRAAQDRTKEVVDELGRMRAGFGDVYTKLNANGESLNSTVHDIVTQLRTGLEDVRAALADLTPPAPPQQHPDPPTPDPGPTVHETPGTERDRTSPATAPVTTITESGELPGETLHSVIPAQRTVDPCPAPGPALTVDAVRRAVREALSEALSDALGEQLAPVLAALTAPDGTAGESLADDRHDGPDPLQEAAGEIKQELGTALEEARSGLASLQREIAGLRGAVEELRTRPGPSSATTTPEVSTEHSTLLKTAARVSTASLLCHRDIWEFLTAHAGRHPHFRVPPHVTGEGGERIRAALSGRSLIALLISLHAIKHTSGSGDGDQELAATLYERIENSLTGLAPDGEPVTIALDDRAAPGPNTPAIENSTPADGEPENTATPPAPGEQNTGTGETDGPATA